MKGWRAQLDTGIAAIFQLLLWHLPLRHLWLHQNRWTGLLTAKFKSLMRI
jgi:hypothetical protein